MAEIMPDGLPQLLECAALQLMVTRSMELRAFMTRPCKTTQDLACVSQDS
jgi:hypothetical protein